MLEELVFIHQEIMRSIPTEFYRAIGKQINWNAQAICLWGDRGVGKTTLMCQHLLSQYENADQALYISADNINVIAIGLYATAKEFFTHGGAALFIDEIHKYPDWSLELKNIIDTFRTKKIIVTSSSSIDLRVGKGDLSRRVVYYRVNGLSFREYLQLHMGLEKAIIPLEQVISEHIKCSKIYNDIPILKYFQDYLSYGYYPYSSEGKDNYYSKLNNTIEKVIYEDVATAHNSKQTTLTLLKKLLWLIATTGSMTPNIGGLSKDLGVSRENIYDCLEYLERAGLVHNVYHHATGSKLVRKPGKIYLNNTNLLKAINGSLKVENNIGAVRETYFINQLSACHKVTLHDRGDYWVDDKHVFEVGGKTKKNKQIKGLDNAFLAIDGITAGYGQRIPLYLFGFLY